VAYRVELRPAALRDLKSLPREVLGRVSAKIDSLPGNPRPPGVEKLSGSEDSYRVRVGDYRILYRILDEVLLVLVVAIRHRKEACRRV
jgi:mRNA interferase RelE/StbE